MVTLKLFASWVEHIRAANLKTDIQVAREKYVVPFLNAKPKTPPAPKEVTQTLNPAISAMASNQEAVGEKIYKKVLAVGYLAAIVHEKSGFGLRKKKRGI